MKPDITTAAEKLVVAMAAHHIAVQRWHQSGSREQRNEMQAAMQAETVARVAFEDAIRAEVKGRT